MKKCFGSFVVLCLFAIGGFANSNAANAQDNSSGVTQPPKVLVIQREFLKLGMSGSVHEKSESAFVQAMQQANSQTYYIAANSLSGRSRTDFFIGYDSFADWQKDLDLPSSNTAVAQQFDSATQADGKLLSGYDSGVFVFDPDKSVSPAVNIGKMRYFEITILQVRLGHDQDFDELAKLHDSIYGKIPGAHWAMFNKLYGTDSGTEMIAITALHSLAELDAMHEAARQAYAQLSPQQKKQQDDLAAAALESVEANLFAIDPKMSYPADKWKAADPEFWGQK